MAGASGGRTLEETPTWAVAVVCFALVAISIFIEYGIHLIGQWLTKRHKRALYESLEKIKSELMLLGFISLLLTVGQGPISDICISPEIAATWHPCGKKQETSKYPSEEGNRRRLLTVADGSARRILAGYADKCAKKGKVAFVSSSGIHQLHIFIFVLAVFHVLYCILTLALGRAKMGSWKSWEKETRTAEYQFSHDPERFRFARETSFGRRHLSFWSKTPVLLWFVCFVRQFVRSVPKVDYLTLRHGFIMAHLAPQSHASFDFRWEVGNLGKKKQGRLNTNFRTVYPERFRFARETSFGRRHLSFWSKTPVLLWFVCFVRQFVRSVPKVDYLTLRHGFIMAHLAPQSHASFDFQKYINRSLEEDFKVVVGISPPIWFFAVLFLLFNTHGWYSYLWLPFIPLIIILLVGTKLQVIITKMGLRIQDRGEVVKGVPVVQPGDDLFWFNRPRLILYLINFVLFQNAFQLAFFAWTWYEFGLKSCFHEHVEDVVIRISMGILVQILCSYVTLPLYALVTQMGSSMKPTIFNDRVATALRNWHHTAKKHVKEVSKHSAPTTPMSSRPATPTHGFSPVHLLRNHRYDVDSIQNSPRKSNFDADHWDSESPSPNHFHAQGDAFRHHIELAVQTENNDVASEPSSSRAQHEIDIGGHNKAFSFDSRRAGV